MGILGKLFSNNITDDEKDLREAEGAAENKVPVSFTDNYLEMTVEDVFTIAGRGCVITGRVSRGSVKVGDTVMINGSRECTVTGLESFRRVRDSASEGDNVGMLLSGITKNDVKRGDMISRS